MSTRAMAAAVVLVLAAGMAWAQPVMPPLPDYGWTFDDGQGTTTTAAYGDVDGTVQGGAQWSATTNFTYPGNGSLEFSGGIGDGQEVHLDDAAGSDKININDGGDNSVFTVSAWIRDRAPIQQLNRANIFGNWFSATQNIMLWSEQGSTFLSLEVRERGDLANGMLSKGTPLGQWVHVTAVWDGSGPGGAGTGVGRIHINDTSSVRAGAAILEQWAEEDTYYIGGDSRGNNPAKERNRMFDGYIDEVAVWKRALTVEEVAWLRENSITAITAGKVVGDANLDGAVDDADLSLLLANWNTDVTGEPDGGWGKGEFNEIAPVDDSDLSLLLANWSRGGAVPGPATVLLIAAGGFAGALRRRRHPTR